MDRLIPSMIIGAILVLAILAMYLGWRARGRRQNDIESLAVVPENPGTVIAVASGLYVATTLANQPLERITVKGLGFRSRAMVSVTEQGVILALTGQAPVFIARESLRAVDRATWTIDTAVESGGLVVFSWQLGNRELDSYLRVDGDSEELLNAAADLIEGAA
ncbi:MAG: ABC transporter permease [Terrimesophilobacter sp.]